MLFVVVDEASRLSKYVRAEKEYLVYDSDDGVIEKHQGSSLMDLKHYFGNVDFKLSTCKYGVIRPYQFPDGVYPVSGSKDIALYIKCIGTLVYNGTSLFRLGLKDEVFNTPIAKDEQGYFVYDESGVKWHKAISRIADIKLTGLKRALVTDQLKVYIQDIIDKYEEE